MPASVNRFSFLFTIQQWIRKANYLFWVILLLLPNYAEATHGAGADLTYKCLGGLQYEITVTFYRDCGGIAEPASIQVNYRSFTGGVNLNATAYKISPTGNEITLPCSTAVTSCNGGNTTGIRQFIYKTRIHS